MNFFMVLIVTWYYGHILASPIDQTQTEEYPIDQTQTEEYIYYDFDYDSDICILPAEFGHVGKTTAQFLKSHLIRKTPKIHIYFLINSFRKIGTNV